jgi:hypothetical protein
MQGYLGQLENALTALNEVERSQSASAKDPSHIDVEQIPSELTPEVLFGETSE